jgi:hypothetical protein
MFVPIHPRRAAAGGKNAQVKVRRAVALAAATGVVAAMVSDLIHAGARGGGGGKGLAIGLAIGIGSALLGLTLARAIGRQGRI